MYLDTSVIVKLLTREADSEHYGRLVHNQVLTASELAYTEVFSALLAKERNGHLNTAQRDKSWKKFQWMLEHEELLLQEVAPQAFRKAQQLILLCYPAVALRTLDAIQLAVCDLTQDFPLVTNDARMMAAAQRLGIPVL